MIKTIRYDAVDRDILKAFCEGVESYEKNAEKRSTEIKQGWAQSANRKNSELKKLAAFGKV